MKPGIMRSQKNVFWEALVIAVFIFGLGILFGIFIENSRADRISEMYLKSEINLLDMKTQTEIINLDILDCEIAIQKNIEFGDRIFEDAKILERYEGASRLTESLVEQHKKYDLLRTIFWINSIKIKERCNADFHTLVYLYDYNLDDEKEKSKKEVFSRFLEELKQERGSSVLLIPIAKDLDLASIDFLTAQYGIIETSILLDESFVVTEAKDLEKITNKINT